jgi:hypothetical protein
LIFTRIASSLECVSEANATVLVQCKAIPTLSAAIGRTACEALPVFTVETPLMVVAEDGASWATYFARLFVSGNGTLSAHAVVVVEDEIISEARAANIATSAGFTTFRTCSADSSF